ncbi:putative disease resistance protein At1g59780 [Castanea sativa]|uniref:putative disease resistance protein At1g59780 n=1 Tax=Castanea sativa TaxID=21020 RepID=UPI003F6492CE
MTIDDEGKKCRLPSALREHFFFESVSDKHFVSVSDKHLAHHCHVTGNNSSDLKTMYKELISCLSFDPRDGYKPGEDVRKFLHEAIASGCFRSLKVLDLEHVFRPQLPNTIGQLNQLKYLGLRWTYLEEIPSFIGNLLNLQTLDVKHTYVRILPKSKWKLQKLRHLYMSQSDRRLTFELELSKQEKVESWVKDLTNLKSLRLRSIDEKGDAQNLRVMDLSKLEKLSSLYLFGSFGMQHYLFNKYPPHLSDLTLSASGLVDDPMPILGKLSKLKSLFFYFGSYKGKEMSLKGFPNLLVLKLWKLESLEELQVEAGAMPKLKELDIRCCNKLKVPTGLKHLNSLQELNLTNMPKDFTTIQEKKWEIWGDIAYPPRITVENW